MNLNPFQQLSGGISPFGSPFGMGGGLGGINPIVSQMMNPYAVSPLASQGGFGGAPFAPHLGQLGVGINPISQLLSPFAGVGQTAGIHPLIVAQLAATNPALLPYLAQQTGVGISPIHQQFGQQYGAGQFGSPFGVGLSPFGQQGVQPFGSPFGQQGIGSPWQQIGQPFGVGQQGSQLWQQGLGTVNPLLSSSFTDPVTSALLSQQFSPLAQNQLPIRPLINPLLQSDPYQAFGVGTIGAMGQGVDPYSVLSQWSAPSPMGINSLQQGLR
jgi:hypothetical protein